MGGQSAQKGYLFQALICLLDALKVQHWNYFTLEPDEGSSKIDLLWEGKNKKAIQIKHSANKFNYADVERLAREITVGKEADSYELILLGAHADKLNKENCIAGVLVHPARQVMIHDLIEQAAHRLDLYLEEKGSPAVPPRIRVLLCRAIVNKLTEFSTVGERVSREQFDRLILEWIVALYPISISDAAAMQCYISASTVAFIFVDGKLNILSPVELLNQNDSPAIIESIAIVVDHDIENAIFLAAWYCHDLNTIQQTQHAFNEFLVPGKAIRMHCIGFIPANDGHSIKWNKTGKYSFSVYVKYGDRESSLWMKEKQITVNLSLENIESIRNQQPFTVSYFPDLPSLTSSLTGEMPTSAS